MTKTLHTLLVLLIAASVLLVSSGTAQAGSAWGAPVVTPLTGDADFTIAVLTPGKLAGAETSSTGLVVPAGFPAGEKQFGGKALVLTGLSYGSVQACFPFPSYKQGWRGSVSQWNGSKWVSMPTTLVPAQESAPTMACATLVKDGTYALLIGLTEPEPRSSEVRECPNIEFVYPIIEEGDDYESGGDRIYIYGGLIYPAVPLGTYVRYEIINVNPLGALTGALTESGNVFFVGPWMDSPEDVALVSFPEGIYVDYSSAWRDLRFTIRIYTTGCYKDFVYPDDLNNIEPN